MSDSPDTLAERLRLSFKKHAERNAIMVDGCTFSYSEVEQFSQVIAAMILETGNNAGSPFVAILGYRSLNVYTGIFGIIMADRAFLPMNPSFPIKRLRAMLEQSFCKTILLSEECIDIFSKLAKAVTGLNVICPNPTKDIFDLKTKFPEHRFVFPSSEGEYPVSKGKPSVSSESPAYLMFTSGSTGIPKGVVVSHKNICTYISYIIRRYNVTPDDRVSQVFELTFDPSVQDIFLSFLAGACLYIVPKAAIMAPAKFIRDNALTIWYSVPSIAMFMNKMKMLKPNSFPSLRWSLFCGEALPETVVKTWQQAAPNSVLENLYGPTEATIIITIYTWNPETSPEECVNGIVPIGYPVDGHQARIVNDKTGKNTEKGELCVAGPQITSGYLNAPEQTAERFINFDDSDLTWYRTGDLVKKNDNGIIIYLGRIDDQLKVRGQRVELQEVDKAIRQAAETDLAICAPSIVAPGKADSLIAVVQGQESEGLAKKIIDDCQRILPKYMVPSQVLFLDTIPLNASGKIDRKTLTQQLSK